MSVIAAVLMALVLAAGLTLAVTLTAIVEIHRRHDRRRLARYRRRLTNPQTPATRDQYRITG